MSSSSDSNASPSPRAVASTLHTVCLLAILAFFAGLLAYLRMASDTPRIGHIPLYGIVIAFEWTLFALCLWHTDAAFSNYLSRVLKSPRSLLWDILTAVLLAAVLLLISPGIVFVLGKVGWVSTEGMLPRHGEEIALWVVMAITAGICEETVFRGYLQQQISGWTGHAGLGIAGQALLFGVCHAYQGWKNVTLIFVWGCVFGVVAWWRKGLRGNMIAHAALDIFAAF
jgi:uncharacterized protein